MSASELVQAVVAQGVELWFEGDRLRFRSPKGALAPEQRAELIARKVEVLTHLRAQAARATTTCPLSFSQRSLWFVNQEAPDSAAYNVSFAARIVSSVDVAAVRQALQAVCDRHASLRVTFPIVAGGPVQQFAGASTAVLDLHDATGEDDQRLQDRVTADYRRPFDLEHGPLFRASLYSTGQQNHVLLLAAHHIVVDGWSLLQLLEEFRALYHEATGGPVVPDARPPRDYAQFTRWQAEMLAGDEGQRLAKYWRAQMASPRAELELPADRPRPPRRSTRGGTLSVDLGEGISARLRQLARDRTTTMFVVLLAAFKTLLFRYTGTDDVVIGTPTFGRNRPEFARVIGDFVNTIPLRSHIDPGLRFSDFVDRLKQTVFDALGAQDFPFPLIVEQLHPVRDPSRSPLFEVLFVMQRFDQLRELGAVMEPAASAASVDYGGLMLTHFPLDQQEGQFDLTLQVVDRSGPLTIQFKYNKDLFDEETIVALSRHYRVLLDAVAIDPTQELGRVPLLASDERAELLGGAARRLEPERRAQTLPGRFEAQVRLTPDAIAVTCDRQHLTYAELNRRANRLAHRLRQLGVGRDTLVGLCTERSLDLVVALVGILKAGGAYLPIDLAYPADRVAFMLEDAAAPVLVTQRSVLERLPAHGATTVFVDDDRSEYPDTDPVPLTRPDDLAYVIYTSGSTGRPKGTMLTHQAVDRLVASTDDWYGFGEQDVWTLFHSIAFDFSVWEVWGALLYGGRLVVVPFMVSRSPDEFLALLHDEAVTVLNQTPSAFRQLVQADLAAGAPRPTRLRYVIFGGEALELQSLRPWFDRYGDRTPQLVNMYGITETCVHVTYRPITRKDLDADAGSVIGVPIPDQYIYLLDARQEPVPLGVPGEIYVGGAGLARGYLKRPDLTEARFIANPFVPGDRLYRSGDLARRRANRELEYLGRIDQQVKIRGFRIELGEIEAVLCSHPHVREAVVLTMTDAMKATVLLAYVVADASVLTAASLREHLGKSVPDYMVPAAFVFIDAVPLTDNGKVDRNALPAPGAALLTATGAFRAPATETERIIAEVFAAALDIPVVGADDNFFELGGHSLLATRVLVLLRERFKRDVPLIALFRSPTVHGLGRWLDDAATGESSVASPAPSADQAPRWKGMVSTQPIGSRPPLFMVTGYMDADDTPRILSNLIPHVGPDQPLCGLRPRWLDGRSPQYASVAEIAHEYITELRECYPRGPYYLLGDCVGGVVATEIAETLIAQGEEVPLLMLLDTERPRSHSFLLMEATRLLDRYKNFAETLRELIRPSEKNRWATISSLVRRKLRRARLSNEPATAIDFLHEHRTSYQRLLKKHRLKRYPGRIELIVTDDLYQYVGLLGWKGFASGGVEVHRLSGDHETVRAQNAKGLGLRIRLSIDRALALRAKRISDAGIGAASTSARESRADTFSRPAQAPAEDR